MLKTRSFVHIICHKEHLLQQNTAFSCKTPQGGNVTFFTEKYDGNHLCAE